ncbi:hypothetical protein SAMN05421854_120115 [Amycolatopsis rubida]|uniref:Uncharacterized protein n=1 Tax=Amycolatopsis rubida TaxID=112413 RepID=A0A1I6ARV0_9PSEU|nr:hypothetical protein SAMN05421854_120115 [Amycolatopsis rubida]
MHATRNRSSPPRDIGRHHGVGDEVPGRLADRAAVHQELPATQVERHRVPGGGTEHSQFRHAVARPHETAFCQVETALPAAPAPPSARAKRVLSTSDTVGRTRYSAPVRVSRKGSATHNGSSIARPSGIPRASRTDRRRRRRRVRRIADHDVVRSGFSGFPESAATTAAPVRARALASAPLPVRGSAVSTLESKAVSSSRTAGPGQPEYSARRSCLRHGERGRRPGGPPARPVRPDTPVQSGQTTISAAPPRNRPVKRRQHRCPAISTARPRGPGNVPCGHSASPAGYPHPGTEGARPRPNRANPKTSAAASPEEERETIPGEPARPAANDDSGPRQGR